MREKNNLKRLTIEKLLECKILIFIILFAGIFLRFYKYDLVPFGINHDSSAVALEAIDIGQNPLPYRPYSKIDWKGETLILYLFALPIKIFGYSSSNIKLYSTILSCSLLPIFYLSVKKIFNTEIATLSLSFLSLSGWHIIMGKTAWPAILLPITECIFFYFIYRTIVYKNYRDGILAGFSLALVMNSYSAAKFILPYSLFILLLLFLKHRKEIGKKSIFLCLMFSLSFMIFVSPLAVYIKNNWTQYTSRSSSVSVVNRIKEAGNLTPLKENIIKTLNIHIVRGNGDDFFVNEPLVDPLSSFFFIIGLCSLLLLLKNVKYQFILSGFMLSLLPGLASVPNGNRGIGSLPFVYLIAGIGFYHILKFIRKPKPSFSILLFFTVFIITFFITFNLYLGEERRDIFGFYPETMIVANYLKLRLSQYDFYLTDNYPRDALTFLTYSGGNPYEKHYVWFENREIFLSAKKKDKGMIFVMFDNEENRPFLTKLKKQFPNGQVSSLKYFDRGFSHIAALIYTVEK